MCNRSYYPIILYSGKFSQMASLQSFLFLVTCDHYTLYNYAYFADVFMRIVAYPWKPWILDPLKVSHYTVGTPAIYIILFSPSNVMFGFICIKQAHLSTSWLPFVSSLLNRQENMSCRGRRRSVQLLCMRGCHRNTNSCKVLSIFWKLFVYWKYNPYKYTYSHAQFRVWTYVSMALTPSAAHMLLWLWISCMNPYVWV